MTKLAIIKTGGKQYKVAENQILEVEKLPEELGNTITFEDVLLVADGKDVKVGTPTVAKATVTAKVLDQGRSKKVTVIKYKAKTRYLRKKGHRQPFTKLQIEKISA
jgi:large subunit ribosomal protein L21